MKRAVIASTRTEVPSGPWALIFMMLIAVLLQSGCVGATGSDGTVGDPAGLNASPSALNFGNVDVGSSRTQNVTVANSGSSDVTIVNVSVSGAGFDASGLPAGLILTPGQSASLAVDFAPAGSGNVSGEVTITADPVETPLPIALSGTGVAPNSHSVTLSWNPSSSSVVGYRAYRADASGGPYTSLNSSVNSATQFTDSNVQGGRTYYYVVTAIGSNNAESLYSNEASAAVPQP